MSKDLFDPQNIPTECNKSKSEGYHIFADICKCEYDKKEQRRKLINEIAKEALGIWGDIRPHVAKIKELSDV